MVTLSTAAPVRFLSIDVFTFIILLEMDWTVTPQRPNLRPPSASLASHSAGLQADVMPYRLGCASNNFASRRLILSVLDRSDCSARRELFVVEIGGGHALLAEPGADCVHHGRRAAQIDVHLAAIEAASLDMGCDVPLARMGAVLGRHASEEGEAGDFDCEFLQPIDAHQIDVIGDAVTEVNRVRTPRLGDFPQHG